MPITVGELVAKLDLDTRDFQRGVAQFEGAVGNMETGLRQVQTRTKAATTSFKPMEGALRSLAVTALGVPGPIGRIAGVLLQFAGGSALAVGVAAGVAGIAFAFQKFTEGSREAREEAKKLADEFAKLDPIGRKAAENFARMMLAEKAKADAARATIAAGGKMGMVPSPVGAGLVPGFTELTKKEYNEALAIVQNYDRIVADLRQKALFEEFQRLEAEKGKRKESADYAISLQQGVTFATRDLLTEFGRLSDAEQKLRFDRAFERGGKAAEELNARLGETWQRLADISAELLKTDFASVLMGGGPTAAGAGTLGQLRGIDPKTGKMGFNTPSRVSGPVQVPLAAKIGQTLGLGTGPMKALHGAITGVTSALGPMGIVGGIVSGALQEVGARLATALAPAVEFLADVLSEAIRMIATVLRHMIAVPRMLFRALAKLPIIGKAFRGAADGLDKLDKGLKKFGDTMAEGERSADEMNEEIRNAPRGFKAALFEFQATTRRASDDVSKLGAAVDDSRSVLETVWDWLKKIAIALAAAVLALNVFDLIKSAGSSLVNNLVDLGRGIINNAGPLWDALGFLASQLLKFGAPIGSALGWLATVLASIIADLGSLAISGLGHALRLLGEGVALFGGMVVDGLLFLVNALLPAGTALWAALSWIGSQILTFGAAAWGALSTVASVVGSEIVSALKWVASKIISVGKELVIDALAWIIGKLIDVLGKLWGAFQFRPAGPFGPSGPFDPSPFGNAQAGYSLAAGAVAGAASASVVNNITAYISGVNDARELWRELQDIIRAEGMRGGASSLVLGTKSL